jgi:hypothetical protein
MSTFWQIGSLAGAVLTLSLMLINRWVRLDRGNLTGTDWIGHVLFNVHAAARRQLFAEAAYGACLTLVILLPTTGIVILSYHPNSLDLDSWNSFQGWRAILLGLSTVLGLWLVWTYWAGFFTSRHHWLKTVCYLHEAQTARRKMEEMEEFQVDSCNALSFCSDIGVLELAVKLTKPMSIATFWNRVLLLSINRHHRIQVGFDAERRLLHRIVLKLEKECKHQDKTLLDSKRVFHAFGGSRLSLFVGMLFLSALILPVAFFARLVVTMITL